MSRLDCNCPACERVNMGAGYEPCHYYRPVPPPPSRYVADSRPGGWYIIGVVFCVFIWGFVTGVLVV